VEGNIKLVIHDGKETQEIHIGDKNYCLVIIPPGLWSGFMPVGGKKAIVCDLTDMPFNPEDMEKAEPDSFAYRWKKDA
jgi:dTDP-4-dehydrorhamnose 3,5-epimerase